MTHGRAILVSGIGKRNALLSLLNAEARAYGARIVGCDAMEWPPARLAVEQFRTVPTAREVSFLPDYAGLLAHEKVAAYLTLIDPEIIPLGELEAAGKAAGARFAHPVPATAAVGEDKYRFFEVMQANGIGTIPTFLRPPTKAPSSERTGAVLQEAVFKYMMAVTQLSNRMRGIIPTAIFTSPFARGAIIASMLISHSVTAGSLRFARKRCSSRAMANLICSSRLIVRGSGALWNRSPLRCLCAASSISTSMMRLASCG